MSMDSLTKTLTEIAYILNNNTTDNTFELAVDLADADPDCPSVNYDWHDANEGGTLDEIRFEDGSALVLSNGRWSA
jgi:hypothetical protein